MATQEKTRTAQEVADRFDQLAKENNWTAIQDELFSDDAESIEPASAAQVGMKNAKGKAAIRQKGEDFEQMVEEMHGGYCTTPVVAGNFFTVAMGMDCTMKGMGRTKMDEIAIYEVKNGQIVKEQFFF